MVNFRSIKPFKALCLGDFLLDVYTVGRVKRISPEAPVPVMEGLSQESRPGGAGNVVLNLRALGGTVISLGRVGADADGETLTRTLGDLLIEPNYRTPVKNRLIAESQQLLRIDFETISPLPPLLETRAVSLLEEHIPQMQVVAISDYGKGFLTPRVLGAALRIAKKHHVPVLVDPKGIDFAKYRGCTLIKPNLSEAYAAAKLPNSATLDEVAAALLPVIDAEHLLITRSEAGMSLFERGGRRSDFPVRSREVKDVTGAGDTALAVIALGLANRLDMAATVQLANIASGLSIERLGCVQVTLPEMAKRMLDFNEDPKVFDEQHMDALVHVLEGKMYSLLKLGAVREMTNALLQTIRQQQRPLVVSVDEYNDLVYALSRLPEVDYIVLNGQMMPPPRQTSSV